MLSFRVLGHAPHEAVVLRVGHLDTNGGPIGWCFDLGPCTEEQVRRSNLETEPLTKARFLGLSQRKLREFWLHVRRN